MDGGFQAARLEFVRRVFRLGRAAFPGERLLPLLQLDWEADRDLPRALVFGRELLQVRASARAFFSFSPPPDSWSSPALT
jgi:hypothetical protein